MLIGVLRFGFMANFLQEGNTFPMLEPYGGDLMAFLITGTMYMSYVSVALDSFRNSIRSEQTMGTLEYLLMSNTPLWQLLIFNGINSFIWTTINVGVIFLFLVLIFNNMYKWDRSYECRSNNGNKDGRSNKLDF